MLNECCSDPGGGRCYCRRKVSANDIADGLREWGQLWELRAKRPATHEKEKKVGRPTGLWRSSRERAEAVEGERSGMFLDE